MKRFMVRPYIPFLVFVVLLLLAIPFSFDFATSVVPGWHTTIFPPYFVLGIVVIIVLLLVALGYWLLSKRTDKINWTLFTFHFALTVSSVVYLKFPAIFLNIDGTNQEELIQAIYFRMKLIPLAWTLFVAGQVLFLIYYIRAIKAK